MPDFTDPPTPPAAAPATSGTRPRPVLVTVIGVAVLVIAIGSFLIDRMKSPTTSASPYPSASSGPTVSPKGTWTRQLGGNNADTFFAVAVARDGTVVTISTTPTATLMTFSPAGDMVISMPLTHALGLSSPASLAVGPDGLIVVAGSVSASGGTDAYLDAYSPTGTPTWSKTLGGPGDDTFTGVTIAPDGTIIAVGSTCSTSGDFPPAPVIEPPGRCGVALAAAFNPAGDMVWAKTYGGDAFSLFLSVAAAPDGSVAVTGFNSATDGNLPPAQTSGGTASTISFVGKLGSDGSLAWAQELGNAAMDGANPASVAVDQVGAVIVAGSSSAPDGHFATAHPDSQDAVVAKFSRDGYFSWCKAVGGSTGSSGFNQVAVTSDGDIVAAGGTMATDGDAPVRDDSAAKSADGLIAKIGRDGTLAWARSYGGSQNDWFMTVAMAGGDFITAAGYSGSNDGDFAPTPSWLSGQDTYAILATITPEGAPALLAPGSSTQCQPNPLSPLASPAPTLVGPNGTWTRTFVDPTQRSRYAATAVAADGTIYAIDDITTSLSAFAPDGTQRRQSWPTSLSCGSPLSLALTPDGNIVVAGQWFASSNGDAFVAELSPTGNEIWSQSLGGSGDDEFQGVAVAPDGTIVAVGRTSSTNGTLAPAPEEQAGLFGVAVAASFTPDGTLRWAKTYGGTESSLFSHIAATPDGSFAVTGDNSSPDGNLPHMDGGGGMTSFVIKLDGEGTIVWANDLADTQVYQATVAVDSAGSIVVAGSGTAIKFTGDGTLIWSTDVEGSSVDQDYHFTGSQFVAVAGAPDGSVVVAGNASLQDSSPTEHGSSASYADGLVARFAADGTPVWAHTYGGSREDWLTTVAVTGDDHVLVGGFGMVNDGDFASGSSASSPSSASPSASSPVLPRASASSSPAADDPAYVVLALLAPDGTLAPR